MKNIEAMPFDGKFITCPTQRLHPRWGGVCTTLQTACDMMVCIREKHELPESDRDH